MPCAYVHILLPILRAETRARGERWRLMVNKSWSYNPFDPLFFEPIYQHKHPLINSRIVRIDLLSFIKPLKVILTKSFVLIKHNRNYKRKYHDKQLKCKIISSLVANICGQILCFLYCITFSSYSKDDLSI